MDKYRTVPIISADDDCIYKFNYAEVLYNEWLNNTSAFVSFYRTYYNGISHTGGYATLHPPYCYGNVLYLLQDDTLDITEDDNFYTAIRYVKNLNECICLNKNFNKVALSHDEKEPLHNLYKNNKTTTKEKINKIINLIQF